MSGSRLLFSGAASLLTTFALKEDYKKWQKVLDKNSELNIAVFCATYDRYLEPLSYISENRKLHDYYFLKRVIAEINNNKKFKASVGMVLSDTVYAPILNIADEYGIQTKVILTLDDLGVEKTEYDLNSEIYNILVNNPIDAILFFDHKITLTCALKHGLENINWNASSSVTDALQELALNKRKESEKKYLANRYCAILS